ncbi:MAG: hypothetical protein AAFV45_15370 [Pseudomonadota bacterium]
MDKVHPGLDAVGETGSIVRLRQEQMAKPQRHFRPMPEPIDPMQLQGPSPKRRFQQVLDGLMLLGALALGTMWAATAAVAGPAIGQFELKDLEAEPGRIEFQSQNAHAFGQPSRQTARDDDDGDLLFDDNSVAKQRHALELETALSRFFRVRIGIEFEKERIDEPLFLSQADDFAALRLEEVALEGVVILVPVPEKGGVGVGFLAEFEAPVFGDDLKTIIFGPIMEFRAGPLRYISNITFVHFFGAGEDGEPPDNKWDLAYAQQLSYALNDTWTLALEAYGTFDRLGNSGRPGEERAAFGDFDQHRIGPIVYYEFGLPGRLAPSGAEHDGDATDASLSGLDDDDEGTVVSIGTGVLFGLNDNTSDATLKWSVEVEF